MPISFKKMDGFYRLSFSEKKIIKTEKSKNVLKHYNQNGEIVAIDFYSKAEN